MVERVKLLLHNYIRQSNEFRIELVLERVHTYTESALSHVVMAVIESCINLSNINIAEWWDGI